jgi:hypothetical protein
MAGNSANYLGHETKLAGAVVSIDQTEEGYLVLAKWLPYPKTQADKGPKAGQADDTRHFLIRFLGKREKVFYTTISFRRNRGRDKKGIGERVWSQTESALCQY